MAAFYNEIEPFAAHWLEALIEAGEVTDGRVERRSIADLGADDISGVVRAHFFAGIGGWDYALKLAGWPADAPVWTGSCPCQPFSAAGKGLGEKDSRHLWPEFRRLIAECRPPVVFGEQVASRAGRDWLAGVRADLEALGYAVGAADLCAASVGAPHIRQRLFWVAHRDGGRCEVGTQQHREPAEHSADRGSCRRHVDGCSNDCGLEHDAGDGREQRRPESVGRCAVERCSDGWLADAESNGLARGQAARSGRAGTAHGKRVCYADEQGPQGHGEPDGHLQVRAHDGHAAQTDSACGWLDDSNRERGRGGPAGERDATDAGAPSSPCGPGRANAWSSAVWLQCSDGKARRVEPGVCPLAHGVPGRVGQLRGYGNAIVPQVAATFVMAFMEAINTEVA